MIQQKFDKTLDVLEIVEANLEKRLIASKLDAQIIHSEEAHGLIMAFIGLNTDVRRSSKDYLRDFIEVGLTELEKQINQWNKEEIGVLCIKYISLLKTKMDERNFLMSHSYSSMFSVLTQFQKIFHILDLLSEEEISSMKKEFFNIEKFLF